MNLEPRTTRLPQGLYPHGTVQLANLVGRFVVFTSDVDRNGRHEYCTKVTPRYLNEDMLVGDTFPRAATRRYKTMRGALLGHLRVAKDVEQHPEKYCLVERQRPRR
jgi:hypothetical protein